MSTEEYLSCEYLQSGLVFLPNRIAACCVSHHDGLAGQPILASFTGGEFPINTITSNRANIIAMHKAGDVHPECDGCPLLTRASWGKPKYFVEKITIANFTQCNLRCSYCYTVNVPELTIPINEVYSVLPPLQQLIEHGLLSPNAIVRFSGGEPTILREFDDILDTMINFGPSLIVYSNGVVPSRAIVRALQRKKVELVLGIDAASPEVYARVKGVDRCNVVWNNVRTYALIDPQAVWAKMIVRYDNIMDVLPFVIRAEKAGINKIYYDLDAGAAGKHAALDQVIQAVALLKYESEKRGIIAECAQAGTQALSELNVERRIFEAFESLAMKEPIGRQLVFKRQLVEVIGLDWGLFEKAKLVLGTDYGLKLDLALSHAADVGDSLNLVSWLQSLDTIFEQAYLTERFTPVDQYNIDLYEQFSGSNWGLTDKNIHGQRWRWLSANGFSQLYFSLIPERNYLLRIYIHTADSKETLDSLRALLNGHPAENFGLTRDQDGLSFWCRIPMESISKKDGFLRMTLTLGNSVGFRDANIQSEQLRRIAFSSLLCRSCS